MAGASGGEMPTTLISPGFSLLRGIRFTLQFRETITIAARAEDRVPRKALPYRTPRLLPSRRRLRQWPVTAQA